MPTPQESADILRRFLAASGGSDIELPRDRNPLDTNRLPPSWQSDDDFEQQVISTSEPRRNPQTLPYPIFDPSNSFHTDPPARLNPLDTNRLPESSSRMPDDANSGRVALYRMLGIPPPDPAEAAAVLATDPMRANDPQALARNRRTWQTELEDRIANEESAAAAPPLEGFVPGEPGRRFTSRLPAANLAGDRARLASLRGEQAADPFTGDAEQARVGRIQRTLDDAATTQRDEVGMAADTLAKRNYFAEYMKRKGMKMGELAAEGSPEAYAAGMTPIRVAGSAESQAVLDAAGQRLVDVAATKNNKGVKYSAPEQQLLDAANSVQDLGPQLLALLEAENPGIGADPDKFGSWTDVLGKEVGGYIYKKGKTQGPSRDAIDQMVGYLEAQIPKMLVPGRVNQKQYEDLKLHAPQLGMSDGANYRRLHEMLTTILPGVLRGMDEAHGPNATSTATPPLPGAVDKYGPPTAAELAAAGAVNTNDRADAILRRR